MALKKTACLASLLLSIPLAAPTLSVAADWDKHPDTAKTTGDATSSGTSEEAPYIGTPDAGAYDRIYIGHAERQGTASGKAEANYNKGNIGNTYTFTPAVSGTTYGIFGGYAAASSSEAESIEVEAKGNTLILQENGYINKNTGSGKFVINAGRAENYTKTGTANASENHITIEKGFSLNSDSIYFNLDCGYAVSYSENASATASGNTVTFEKETSYLFPQQITVVVGTAEVGTLSSPAGGTGDATASGNEITINKMANTTVNNIYIGYVVTGSSGKAIANKNIGKLVFGENVKIANNVYGGHVFNYRDIKEGSASENELDVTGGTWSNTWGTLYTGWLKGTGKLTAYKNITTLTNVVHKGVVAGGYASEVAFNGKAGTSYLYANNNSTTITDSTLNEARSGYAQNGLYAEAKENTLTMTGGSVSAAYAGLASIENTRSANNKNEAYVSTNTLTLQDTVSDYAYAGYSKAVNSNTSFKIQDSAKKATAEENTLTVAGGSSTEAYAGYAESDNDAESLNNKVYLNYDPKQSTNLDTATEIKGTLYGGYAEGTNAKATGNNGILTNTTFSSEEGGFTGGKAVSKYNDNGEAVASSNIFTITGSKLTNVYGGQAVSENSSSATAKGNVLTLSGAEVSATIYGGYAESTVATDADADATSGEAAANTNTLSLYGGTYSCDNIYAGYASSTNSKAESGSNTVELYALDETTSPSFSTSTVIWGGYAAKGDTEVASTGNTLTFNNVNGMEAANIKNFQNLTFTYDTTTLAANDVVLTLNGGEDGEKTTIADGGKISVSVTSLKGEGSDVFNVGDKVYLLKNANGLALDEEALSLETVTATTGNGALECTVQLGKTENELYLTIKDESEKDDDDDGKDVTPDDGKHDDGKKDDVIHAAPGTKAIAEGALAGLALASESHEAVSEVLDNMSDQDVFTFGTVHAANKTYESGSSITVSSVSLIAGLGKGFAFDAGHLSVGAFFEYGKGSYTTHNSFDSRSDIDGDGTSWYMGGGILAKMNFAETGPGHFYVEGSAHMGTVHNEFDSNGFTDGKGNVAKFDMDSPYYSLHGGLGYVWNMAEGHELNMYGKYLWTMVQGTDDTLTTNAKFDYDDMHSNRVRGGVRYSYTGSERFKPYVGVAYEHEFSGSCDSRAFGYDVNSPSYEGGSGIGELGIAMMPTDALPLSFNLGVQGSVGKKRGVSGNCNVVYEF